MNEQSQLVVVQDPFKPQTRQDWLAIAEDVAKSKMFGVTTVEQAMCLFYICKEENISPLGVLREYHIIEGRPSMRADAMLAKFLQKGGHCIFHVRTDDAVGATFISPGMRWGDTDKKAEESKARGISRFKLLWKLEFEQDAKKRGEIMGLLSDLSFEGEETILRTYADCEAKGLTQGKDGTKANWQKSPRQMLTARCVTEGIRLVAPGLIAGMMEEGEAREVAEQEREVRQVKLVNNDKEAMEEILQEHIDNAEVYRAAMQRSMSEDKPSDAAFHREEMKRYQGLASELRCKIADLEVKPKEEPKVLTGELEVMPRNQSTMPQESPEEDNLPGVAEPPPSKPSGDFREYVIQKAKAYAGKKLVDLSKAELKVLFEARATAGYLSSKIPDVKHEAEMIKKAWEAVK